MRSKNPFFILGLVIVATFASRTLQAETLLCGQDGKGKFRLDSVSKTLQFVQPRKFLPDFIAPVRTYDSLKNLSCGHCFSVSGEFYAGANVVVELVTKSESGTIVANITTGTTEGGVDVTDHDVPCVLEIVK